MRLPHLARVVVPVGVVRGCVRRQSRTFARWREPALAAILSRRCCTCNDRTGTVSSSGVKTGCNGVRGKTGGVIPESAHRFFAAADRARKAVVILPLVIRRVSTSRSPGLCDRSRPALHRLAPVRLPGDAGVPRVPRPTGRRAPTCGATLIRPARADSPSMVR